MEPTFKPEEKKLASILDLNDELFPSNEVMQEVKLRQQNKRFLELDEKYKRDFLESIENGSFPFFPDSSENLNIVDTTIPVKLGIKKGPENLKNTLLIMAKIKQAELGAPTPEYVTNEQIQNAMKYGIDTDIIESERANGIPTIVSIKENPSDPNSKVIGYKDIIYYNLVQLKNPENMKQYIVNGYKARREQWKQEVRAKWGSKAYDFKSEKDNYPAFKTPSFEESPMLCQSNSSTNVAANIIGQAIVAGLRGKYLRMYKGEADLLKTELNKILKEDKKRVVNDFGKAVGEEIDLILKSINYEKKINGSPRTMNSRQSASAEYEMER